jgi:hypothetical protein
MVDGHIVVRELVGIDITVDTRWSEIPQMEVKRIHENSSQHCLFLSMKSAHFPHEFYFPAKLINSIEKGIFKALAWTSNTSCMGCIY